MVLKKVLLSALVFSGLALAQGTINTYAGNDALFEGSGQPATAAQLVGPNYIAVDAQGNVYFSASGLAMVLKVTAATGIISVVAGNGLSRYGGDGGFAVGTPLGYPSGLAFDSSGNLYIADSYNSNVRKVDTNGIITTAAGGQGKGGYSGDGGPATQALLSYPTGIATDKSGNLYIMELGSNHVRMVKASTGIISTIAGNGLIGYTGDGGPALQASFNYPEGLAVDSADNVYVCDQNTAAIRRFSVGGIITTVAGNGKYGFSGDNGPATQASLLSPTGVAFDASGNMYIADSGNERIRYVNSSGIITTIAGTGTAGFGGDGSPATAATFSNPIGIALDASGAVYVADGANNRIRRFVVGGAVATFAGTATSVGDGGPSPQAALVSPSGVSVDSAGNLYISDSSANRIRKVTPSGTIGTVAGNGQTGGSGNNGPATAAALNSPYGVAADSAGDLYIAVGDNEIRRVDAATGKITAFAGPGCCYGGAGTGGDGGPATAALLLNPRAVAVDGAGNVYFVDQIRINGADVGVAVRRVDTKGIIDIWVGGGPVSGFSGDDGSPLKAQLSGSLNTGIATGPDGSLYIADTYNNRVRKVDPAGATINTVAGNGQSVYSGDGGPATAAGVPNPLSVAVDAAGNLYIGSHAYVRKVTSSGIIGPYVDNGGQYGFSGDGGPATAASIAGAVGLAVDSGSNLYIADSGNRRVRQVQPAASPVIALSSTSVTFTLTATGSTATTQTFVLTNSGQGTLNWAAAATTTSGGAWLSVSPAIGSILAGQAGTTVTVTANPSGLAAGDYYGQIQVTSPEATSRIQMVTVRLTVQTAGEAPPQVFAGGVLNAASYTTPVVPGTFISIFGSGFTDSTSAIIASAFPWLNELGGTSVTIGGEPIPLYFVTAGQINAILPFDLPVNTSLPIVVTRNNAVSAPQPVSIISDQPGMFTQSENGRGIGAIEIFRPDGSYEGVAGNGNSATAGDVVVIYCTGLGGVNPRAVAGYPAPPSPLSQTIDPVTMTIGGVNVPVFFAGLAPGYAGLYQVNATIPGGIAPNPTAPLVLTQGGQKSPTVTIPMQ